MTVLERSLVAPRIKLQVVRLAGMSHGVRSGNDRSGIRGRIVDNVRAAGRQRIDVRRRRITDYLTKGMILFDDDNNVIKSRLLRRHLPNENKNKKDQRVTKIFHN